MATYSFSERLDMYNVYIRCNRNSVVAAQNYERMYPERRQPNRNIFQRLYRRLELTGTLNDGIRHRVIQENPSEINVLAQIEINPEISQRKIAAECNLSLSGVHRIIKKHKYHDYKILPVQKLHPGDAQRRLEFSAWFRNQLNQDPNFASKILWSDETLFTNGGMFNRRNKHFYAIQNPHLVREVRPQIRYSLNVWCGLLGNQLLGPYFIPGNLNGQSYLNFLQNEFEDLLDNLPLATLRNLEWFQQDGAAPHNARIVRGYLDNRFPNSWIGTYGPIHWPPRSPCLNPLDYFLWGSTKNRVYDRPIENINDLQARIIRVFESITPEYIESAIKSMDRRIMLCIQQGGHHFEQFL